MTAADLPIPADLAFDAPPLTDDQLDAYFAEAEHVEDAHEIPVFSGEGVVDEFVADDEAWGRREVRAVAGFQVTDLATAEWAMRKLAEAEAERAALAEQRDSWMERIGAWFDQASKRPTRTANFMTDRLLAFGRGERERNPRVATIPLPSGTIKTTASRPAVEVADDAALASYIADRLTLPPVPASDAALARYRTWQEAVAEAEAEGDNLVKYTPKVYAGPLRAVASVQQRKLGDRVTVTLSCDHSWSFITNGEHEYTVGVFASCSVCEPDPIDGARSWPVREVVTEDEYEVVVVGPDGEPLPGVAVRPGGVSVKVVPS